MSTKDRILDSAEKIFARKGFDATSLRDITSDAGVNLAAVNYHFQSKESLITAVLARRLDEVNARRLEMLEDCIQRAGSATPRLEALLEAFYRPPLEAGFGENRELAVSITRLLGRVYGEPERWIEDIYEQHLEPVAERFVAALRRSLPGLPDQEFFWRLHFGIGAMAHTMIHLHTLDRLSGGRCNTNDFRLVLRQMVAFVAAGFRAAMVGKGVNLS